MANLRYQLSNASHAMGRLGWILQNKISERFRCGHCGAYCTASTCNRCGDAAPEAFLRWEGSG